MVRSMFKILLLLIISATNLHAEETLVPLDRQAKLLLKVLSYDKTLQQRVGKQLSIGVLFDPDNAVSTAVARDGYTAFHQLRKFTVQGMKVTATMLAYRGGKELAAYMKEHGINTLYVTPGLDDALSTVLRVSRAMESNTITGVEKYVTAGVAVGVVLRGKQPKILINLVAAAEHGNKFSSEIFRVSEVIQ